jgi:hypothetical protein
VIQCKAFQPKRENILGVYRLAFTCYPEVDEHEFATAYVKHVATTGNKPDVFDAIHSFWKTGKVTP